MLLPHVFSKRLSPWRLPHEISMKLRNISFICAILVIFIHTSITLPDYSPSWYVYQFILNGVTRVAVPYFFAISGFFALTSLSTRNWRDWLAHRIPTLLTPYILFNLGWALVDIAFIKTKSVTTIDWGGIFGVAPWGMPILFPLWFLKDLLILSLITPLSVCLFKKNIILGLLPSIALLTVIIVSRNNLSCGRFLFGYSADGIIWYTTGMCAHILPWSRIRIPHISPFIIVSTTILLLIAYTYLCNHALYGLRHYLIKPIIPLLFATLWVITPIKLFARGLIASTFPIYLLHFALLQAILQTGKVLRFSTLLSETLLGYFIQGLLATVLAIVISIAIHRLTPRVAAMLFGGR